MVADRNIMQKKKCGPLVRLAIGSGCYDFCLAILPTQFVCVLFVKNTRNNSICSCENEQYFLCLLCRVNLLFGIKLGSASTRVKSREKHQFARTINDLRALKDEIRNESIIMM